MKDRVLIIGEVNEFLTSLCKYLNLNGYEVFLAINKNQEISNYQRLERMLTIIRFNDSLEEIKFIISSIEPIYIYNLYGMEYKKDVKYLVEKNYLNVVLLLETIKEYKDINLINIIEERESNINGDSVDIYSTILDSVNKVIKYYKDVYGIETLIKSKYEYNEIIKNK